MADTPATRIEHDSMGELHVPADALWGAQTQRAVENFPMSGRPMPRSFIRALGLVKAAAADANGSLGLLPETTAAAIIPRPVSLPISLLLEESSRVVAARTPGRPHAPSTLLIDNDLQEISPRRFRTPG